MKHLRIGRAGLALIAALAVIVSLSVGCGRGEPPEGAGERAMVKDEATATPVPEPSATPIPTATPVPEPSATPIPTATSAPEPTPVPTEAPTPRVIRRPSEGAPEAAPGFMVETFDGQTLRLSDLEGKVVVLNFWASWCPPCRWEMPSFERIWQEYRERDVVFVGIAMSDTFEDASEFAEASGVTYPLALDTTHDIAREYEVVSLPTTFFIDKAGHIQRRFGGPANDGVLKIFLNGQLE